MHHLQPPHCTPHFSQRAFSKQLPRARLSLASWVAAFIWVPVCVRDPVLQFQPVEGLSL